MPRLVLLLAALLAASGCSPDRSRAASATAGRDTLRITFITHGQSADVQVNRCLPA